MGRRRARSRLLAVLVLGVCAGCDAPGTPAPGPATATAPATSSAPDSATGEASRPGEDDDQAVPLSAVAVLATLEVKGRAPRTGYDRDLFGPAWADTDRNGCDTRNDVLRRDLVDVTTRPGTRDCVVASGTLTDPYSGRRIAFVRGEGTSEAVQVDHVVALSDAWQKGAQQWTPQQRLAFANDPLNLLADDGPLNQQKGDGDAATWLPPNRGYRCSYVARQIAVKSRYGAWVTAAERDAMSRVLADCPHQQLPDGGTPPAAAAPAPPVDAGPSTGASCDPAYPDVCVPAFADVGDLDCGDLPQRRFAVVPPDPHRLDADGNGVGCEG
ncbi:DUF1524 domain-containing protein [Thalassiella azotivora]